jgi:hypothetical protein
MADLTATQQSELVRITGSDAAGVEQTPVQSTANGAIHTNLRNSSGAELGISGAPVRVDPTGTTTQPVSDAGGSLTVDGTITANQGGTWNINNISGTVSLPTGASTSALQTTGNSSLSSIDTKTPALVSGRVPVDGSGVIQPTTGSATSVSGTISGNGDLISVGSLAGASGLAVQIYGTFNTTLTFQGSTNGGSNWFDVTAIPVGAPNTPPSAIQTATGLYYVPSTFTNFRIVSSDYVSGTVSCVTAIQSNAPSVLNNLFQILGAEQTSFSPDPSSVDSDNPIKIAIDPVGRQETHSTVLTDEGSFSEDFPGSSLYTTLTGTVSFTNGSAILTGTGTTFTSQLKSGDYIKKTTDGETLLVRVDTVVNDEELELETAYAGTTAATTAHKSNWLTYTAGAGSAINVASSTASIVCSTANSAITGIQRFGDYGPYLFQGRFSISQRIANQTLRVGMVSSASASPGIGAWFEFSGTVNTQVICTSRASTDASEIQQTTITLPNGVNSSQQNRYEINVSNNGVSFVINGTIVAFHTDHIPGPYDTLSLAAYAVNTAVVTATTLAADYVRFINLNQVEIASSFLGEPLRVQQVSSTPPTYSAAIDALNVAGSATDIFTITGSATKVVRIKRISLSGWRTANTQFSVIGLRRSTANSGGTSTTPTVVPYDSSYAAGTAVARAYTANPTLGTLVGNLFSQTVAIGTQTPGNAQSLPTIPLEIEFQEDRAPVIRGTNEVFALNLAATTIAGSSLRITVEWTEGDR